MKSRNSLSLKLSLTILSIILLIFVSIVFYNFRISQGILLKEAENNAKNISHLTISQIEDALNSVENASGIVAGYISQNFINQADIDKMLRLLANNDEQITSSFVLLDQGGADSNPSEFHYYYRKDENGIAQSQAGNVNTTMDTWLKRIIERNEAFWSEPYLDPKTGDMEAAYLVPAYFSDMNHVLVKGLVGIELRLKWLQEVINTKKVFKSDYIFIISKEGKPVLTPGKRYDNDTDIYAMAKEMNNPAFLELGKKMMKGETGFEQLPEILTDVKSVVYYSPVPSTNWSVAVVFPDHELYSDLYFTTIKIAVAGLLGFILICIATILILRRLTQPLRELAQAANTIGHGNFEVIMPDIKSNDEVGVLKDSLLTMQLELQSYIQNLVKTEKEKEHIESELQVAKAIQMGYLRQDFDTFSAGKDIEIAALIKPAHEVGGDFYDYFMVDESTVCISIGDVAGKGVPAALLMTIVLSLTRSGNYTGDHLKTVVEKINNLLCRQNENSMFTTFFIGLLNIRNRELTFCNAGHNFPYLIRDEQLFEVRGTHGIALGVIENQVYKTGKLSMNIGDAVILYTDGITDAENQTGEFFNKNRLEDVLMLSKNLPVIGITKAVHQQLKKFTDGQTQSDDFTVLAVRYKDNLNNPVGNETD